MTRTTAFGLYDNCVVGLLERVTDHMDSLNLNICLVSAFGLLELKAYYFELLDAFERHIAFNNNDVTWEL